MSVAEELYISPEEYLERERQAETRSEYFNGRIYAMAGASRDHDRIATNIRGSLWSQLQDRSCEAHSGDVKVRIPATDAYTYPDASVVCAEDEDEGSEPDVIRNPRVIVEVLSPSTEAYDRGGKFAHYRTLTALTDYLLVAQDRPVIEHFRRAGDQWVLTVITGRDAVLSLESVGCELPLSQVYQRVPFADDSTSE